jgi:hypothetical protein
MSQLVIVTEGSGARDALRDGVRARVRDGWEVVDAKSTNDGFAFTLVATDARVERHVLRSADHPDRYEVEREAALPPEDERQAPHDALLGALVHPTGGFDLEAGCGGWTVAPYVVEGAAGRDAAPRVVASVLANADDLQYAFVNGGIAGFDVVRGDELVRMNVWLDRNGRPIEVRLRNYGMRAGEGSYTAHKALRTSVRRGSVAAIRSSERGIVLVRTAGAGYEIAFDKFNHGGASGDGECGC